jgi:hypothetical protein
MKRALPPKKVAIRRGVRWRLRVVTLTFYCTYNAVAGTGKGGGRTYEKMVRGGAILIASLLAGLKIWFKMLERLSVL